MSKVKMKLVNTGWGSFFVEDPQSKKVYERQENKRVSRQVKRLNRNQQRVLFGQFGRKR